MIIVPVSVRTYNVKISVVNDTVRVVIVPSAITATLVSNMITAALIKENIPGLKLTDSPEFADTEITTLATEATYPAAVWSYLVGLFTTVPKSVKAHLVKIWGNINDMATRVGILEDSYLLKYVVPVDSVGFDLTHDRYGRPFSFTDGDLIEIAFRIDAWVNNGADTNRINIRLNRIWESIYQMGSGYISYIFSSGTSYQSIYPIVRLQFIKNEVIIIVFDKFKKPDGTYTQYFWMGFTTGLNGAIVNTLNFITNTPYSLIPAGTEIIIKKL